MLIFFFNDTATTEIYTLSLHDALPISITSGDAQRVVECLARCRLRVVVRGNVVPGHVVAPPWPAATPCNVGIQQRHRSEEHTSELQSRQYLVCRLLLEKKNNYLLNSCT